jgi:RimJ/RimL family protein N-acetyltransferase
MADSVADALAPPIRTARFELVSLSLDCMRHLVVGDLDAASTSLGATFPPELRDGLDAFLQFRIADLVDDPATQPWLGRAVVVEDDGGRHVIGTAGFHAPPGPDGRVEIGYRVVESYRRRGVATEVAAGLFDWAAAHGVTRFRASTAPDNAASQAVLAKFGFRQVGEQMDDLDGLELVFERDGWPPSP